MTSSRRNLDTGRPRRALLAPVAAGILAVGLGLLLNFTTVLLARLDRMPGGRADRQLLNFLFDHSWGWLNRSSIHKDFWSPGFFFPMPNVLAYSDVVIAFAPLYWPPSQPCAWCS